MEDAMDEESYVETFFHTTTPYYRPMESSRRFLSLETIAGAEYYRVSIQFHSRPPISHSLALELSF